MNKKDIQDTQCQDTSICECCGEEYYCSGCDYCTNNNRCCDCNKESEYETHPFFDYSDLD